MNPWLFLIVGVILGSLVTWLWGKSWAQSSMSSIRIESEGKIQGAQSTIAELRAQLQESRAVQEQLKSEELARAAAETRLAQTQANLEEQRALLQEARTRLADSFRALAAEALKSNNQAFITLAKSTFETVQAQAKGDLETRQKEIQALVAPLKDSLDRYEREIQEMEKTRQNAYGGLEEQLRGLATVNQQLQKEAGTLANALKGGPQARGRWGEMTLRRAAELAGMAEHCDFVEQETLTTDAGRLRPDMVVTLPGGRRIAGDAKAPLQAFIDAASAATDEARNACLARHSRLVRDHMNKLALKAYWDQFDHHPEFVVLFLPVESFFAAALEQDHELMEDGMKKRVVLATPTTLVALLKAAAYGWRQESVEQNALRISDLGKQLYDRLRTFAAHFTSVGASLGKAISAYNNATGSLERSVLVPARKLKELGAATGDEIPEISPIEAAPRELSLPERASEAETGSS